jgi:Tfp pilus assembly protein PilX
METINKKQAKLAYKQQEKYNQVTQLYGVRQQGSVLIWSIIILLILTMIGLSAVKTAGIGSQITGNSLFSMLVFQGAESALAKTANIHYTTMAENNVPTRIIDVPSIDLPDEKASNGSLRSTVNVAWGGYRKCPITSFAVSTSVATKSGGVACQHFDIAVKTALRGTGARTNHTLGVVRYGPALHVTTLRSN